MVNYECKKCNFLTLLKSNYTRHLKTSKHSKNIKNACSVNPIILFTPSETLQKPPKIGHFPSDLLQFPPPKFTCEHCNMSFSRKDNLNRHLSLRCKKKELNYKELFYDMKKELEKEKKEFRKHIEILLNKVGNTTINNTQNIQLNNYGKEDLSHITDTLKTQLIKMPFGMIPKLIKEVHFNDLKPENKNIALTNKKDNKIKVFSGNKWILKNKNETLNDLVDGKYFILDNHYDNIYESLDSFNKNIYDKFRLHYDKKNTKLLGELNNECELMLLNNR